MKKHVGYADGKRLILNRKRGKKFNLGGGVNDFKNNAIAKLKQWKNEKLEDINYSAKILGITSINPSYIKAFNKLNDLVEDCTKIIKSGILKDGEFTYWKTFNVKTYKGSIETQAYFTLEKEIAYSNPKFDKDFIEFKTKYPYSTKDSFSKEFIGRMTIPILGYKLCDYATIGHSTANSVGGFKNNLYAKGGKPLLLKIGDKVEGYFHYDHTYGQYNIIPYNAYADNSKGIVIDIIKGASWPRYKIKFENGETLNLAEFMLGEYYDKLNYAKGGMPQGLSIADANPYIAGAKAIKGIAPSSFSALDERLAKKINPDPYRPVFF